MPSEKICKTIHQYSKGAVPEEDMRKLLDIAEDYRKVKNYVYARFGSIGSLGKLYPGYTVQNEMTGSGFRETLGLPSVYFYLAVFDALGDIKCQWTKTKTRLRQLINKNEGFTGEEKHYLRFLLKVNNAFDAVLNQKPVELTKKVQKQYDELASQVETKRLHRYLCRQVRKSQVKLYTDTADGFSAAERAYRYADGGIYLSIKEKRKRIFIPLTDNNQYACQVYIKLYPPEQRIEIKVPIQVTVRCHADYQGCVGIALGMYTMITTDGGHCYGEELGRYQSEYTEWVRMQTKIYNRSRQKNPGRKKYHAKKHRMEEQLHSYINKELNRFLRLEKPGIIYMVKLPKPQSGGINRTVNYSVSSWQRGYIRKRLEQKCREQSVEIAEVLGKDISCECSNCGAPGEKTDRQFFCSACGYHADEKVNTARNVKKRGQFSTLSRNGKRSYEQPFR